MVAGSTVFWLYPADTAASSSRPFVHIGAAEVWAASSRSGDCVSRDCCPVAVEYDGNLYARRDCGISKAGIAGEY